MEVASGVCAANQPAWFLNRGLNPVQVRIEAGNQRVRVTTLDLGCGEGRLSRDLAERGHRVVSVDSSPTLARAAAAAAPEIPVLMADGAALPLAPGSFDLVIAYMSLQDMDDMAGAVAEAAR